MTTNTDTELLIPNENMEQVARRAGLAVPTAIAYGLTLLDYAMEAQEQGNRIAIVDNEGKVACEIDGVPTGVPMEERTVVAS